MCSIYICFVLASLTFLNFALVQVIQTRASNNYPNTNVKNKLKKYHISKSILQLYQKKWTENKESVIRGIIPEHIISSNDGRAVELIFELPRTDDGEVLTGAELRILVKFNDDLVIQRTFQISTFYYANKTYEILQETLLHQHTGTTWISFNLTSIIKGLTTEKSHNIFKVVISISSCLPYCPEKNFKLHLIPESFDDSEPDYPVLIMSYSSNFQKVETRKKRSLNGIHKNDEEATNRVLKKHKENKICRRESLYINFTEINFDVWVIQPLGYEAYQCRGKCFYPSTLYPTNHAVLQALLHYSQPKKISRTCCVPIRLAPISMIYFDDKGILTFRRSYPNMVVEECGCR